MGLGNEANDLNTARRYIHLTVGEQAHAFMRIDGAVRQNQLKWRAIRRSFLLRFGIDPVGEMDVLLFAD